MFQFDQEEEEWSFSPRGFICLLQSLTFSTGLASEAAAVQGRCSLHRLSPQLFVLSARALLEAGGAACLSVGVQLRGHGVGDHASQDVVLRRHHVLDEKIGRVIDVEVVLKARQFSYGQEREGVEITFVLLLVTF